MFPLVHVWCPVVADLSIAHGMCEVSGDCTMHSLNLEALVIIALRKEFITVDWHISCYVLYKVPCAKWW